jgi:nitrite reductase (NO-forming)
MERKVNSNVVTGLIVALAILLLVMLPITIRFIPNQAVALEAQSSAVAVERAEISAKAQIVEYTLRTEVGGTPAMAYVGVGGDIDGLVNPELKANVGDTVHITVINGDPVLHDLKIDKFGVHTEHLTLDEQTVTVEFVATQPGEFEYYCSIPGHREIGMKGLLHISGEAVTTDDLALDDPALQQHSSVQDHADASTVQTVSMVASAPAIADAVSIVRNPADVPLPLGDRGTTYRYMTFDGQIPGPMLRVRVGDTIELHLTNDTSSQLPHSIDLHAVTGPGGGALFTQIMPGEASSFTFQALQPGLYVYHCATASIGHHISSGMYGLILVEPVGGLPPVDREFYVMQGELYTTQPFGTAGHLDFSHEKMLDEDAEYFTFNGAAGALAMDENAMRAQVGETVRIYFGVGGPNAISSFHLIGEIFDRVYDQASLTSPPLLDVQTTLVAPGGATMVEFKLDVPGRYILVDHALSRAERGLAGYLYAEGEENPAIFHGAGTANDVGH